MHPLLTLTLAALLFPSGAAAVSSVPALPLELAQANRLLSVQTGPGPAV